MLNRGGDAIHATVDVVGEVNLIKTDTSGDGIRVRVDNEAELAQKVEQTEGPHTMEEIMMAKQDRFDHATVDEEVAVAEDNFEGGGVQVPVEMGPEVDKDEEGGGDVPTPDDKEAGRLRIMMTKQECFAHGGEGGIAKSAMAAPFFLVANAGQLRPRDVYQTHFASSA